MKLPARFEFTINLNTAHRQIKPSLAFRPRWSNRGWHLLWAIDRIRADPPAIPSAFPHKAFLCDQRRTSHSHPLLAIGFLQLGPFGGALVVSLPSRRWALFLFFSGLRAKHRFSGRT